MAYRNIPNISIEDARIIFKNFSGKGSDFNAEGVRNFCLVLDEEKCGQIARRRMECKGASAS